MSTPVIDPAAADEKANTLIVSGALLALLTGSWSRQFSSLRTVDPVIDAEGNLTGAIDISLSFMRSVYRLTVERLPDGDH